MSRRNKKTEVEVKVQKEEVIEPSGKDEVLEAFQYFDQNGKGTVSARELRVILSKLGNNPFTEEEIKEIFTESNVDEDGTINYQEFVEFWDQQ
jgi:Ca2+-binding EF-hand superfamily protein